MVLEDPKVGQITIHNHLYKCAKFIIFPCSLHRAAIDSHWTKRRIIIIIIKHTIAIGV